MPEVKKKYISESGKGWVGTSGVLLFLFGNLVCVVPERYFEFDEGEYERQRQK